jgi:hypothetical protein
VRGIVVESQQPAAVVDEKGHLVQQHS